MKRRAFLRLAAGASALSAITRSSWAQEYPSRRITIVVPYAAGGSTDLAARHVADHMAQKFGQPVTVENVTGAGSTLGTARVAHSAPDGYTLLVHQNALGVNATAYPKLPFDTETDIKGVGMINHSNLVLAARKSLPENSFKELVEKTKRTNAQVKLALAAGIGSLPHLAMLAFQQTAGVKFDFIPYRGAQAVVPDILAGNVDIVWLPPDSSLEYIRAGSIKGIAVSSQERMSQLPAVPSVTEMGYPSLELRFWQGLFAPAKTPDGVIQKLNAALRDTLADPKVQETYEKLGVLVYRPEELRPELATQTMLDEIKRWRAVIKANKIELEL